MPLNIESKTSYYQFDSAGMLCVPSDQSWEKRSWWKKLWDWIIKREWAPTWSNKSWRDSLGRTILARLPFIFQQEYEAHKLRQAIEKCYCNGILYRHPESNEIASRDHHSYFFIYRKMEEIEGVELPDFPRMRGMNNWMKALTGNKRAEKRYYFWAIPGAYLGNFWLSVFRWVGRIEPERKNEEWIIGLPWNFPQRTYGERIQKNRTTWQNIWGKIILNTIPAFALHIKAWQIYVMPESEKKKRLQEILLRRVAKRNVLVRLVLGDDTVTQEEVDNIPHMTGFPWGVYLDESCRRDIREMTEQEREFNSYEYDLIQWLYKFDFQ